LIWRLYIERIKQWADARQVVSKGMVILIDTGDLLKKLEDAVSGDKS
jgi:hypothetical protein